MRDVLLVLLGGALAMFLQIVFGDILVWMLRPDRVRHILLLPLSGEIEDIERRLRWALFCLDDGRLGCERLLCALDMGLSQEGKALAQRLLTGRSDAMLCGSEKLRWLMEDDKVYKELEFVLY